MQDKVTWVGEREAETAILISSKKTEVMQANTNNQAILNVNLKALKEVVGSTGDVSPRIGKARTAFRILGNVCRTGRIYSIQRLGF